MRSSASRSCTRCRSGARPWRGRGRSKTSPARSDLARRRRMHSSADPGAREPAARRPLREPPNGRPEADAAALVHLDRAFARLPEEVVLTGQDLTVSEVRAVARHDVPVHFTEDAEVLDRIERCYQRMMQDVADGTPVYGCNTGYGAQAANVLTTGSDFARAWFARAVSDGIAALDVSVGPVFSPDVVRAAILVRVNMLMCGVSAVKLADLDLYRQLLNRRITPLVNQYGGL